MSWEKESRFALPVATWKELMEQHYPGSAWLCVDRQVFDELHEYKSRCMLPTWEQCLCACWPTKRR